MNFIKNQYSKNNSLNCFKHEYEDKNEVCTYR